LSAAKAAVNENANISATISAKIFFNQFTSFSLGLGIPNFGISITAFYVPSSNGVVSIVIQSECWY
jgi:hypothetical protein